MSARRAPPGEHAELLAAIYAAPDDDAPRAVYADWLQERGDPRGDFIALQLAGIADARTAELLDAHRAVWLGPLPIEPPSARFERGFVVAGRTHKLLDDHPAWATVREIDRVPASDRCHTASLRVLERLTWRAVDQLARLERPLAVERASWQVTREAAYEAASWARVRVLPELRALAASAGDDLLTPARVAWAWTSPHLPRLTELALAADPRRLAAWHAVLAPTRIARAELASEPALYATRAFRMTLARDERGALARLELVAPELAWPSAARERRAREELLAGVAALPAVVTRVELAISARRWPSLGELRDALLRVRPDAAIGVRADRV